MLISLLTCSLCDMLPNSNPMTSSVSVEKAWVMQPIQTSQVITAS